ncbi:hypothetical protein L6452_09558 [Arctium lappa]|uniref:Uncharacterized protein n=1 Tax=Arctium lappa TaxID=4217 RepID=A0ACB9DKN2_ARCLA|nr:hypothetical protein L6452_09558 [Arctium lappa]
MVLQIGSYPGLCFTGFSRSTLLQIWSSRSRPPVQSRSPDPRRKSLFVWDLLQVYCGLHLDLIEIWSPSRGMSECVGDVWSLGCGIIEMATGCNPWPEINNLVSALYKIGYSGDVPLFPMWLSVEAKDFLNKC